MKKNLKQSCPPRCSARDLRNFFSQRRRARAYWRQRRVAHWFDRARLRPRAAIDVLGASEWPHHSGSRVGDQSGHLRPPARVADFDAAIAPAGTRVQGRISAGEM